jgi:hypothetical protein
LPLGFEAGLIPRTLFFISEIPFASSVRKIISSQQQDLPDTALFCRRLSLGRLTQWHFSLIGITSLPPRTASVMNSSVFLSNFENTGATFTESE